MQVEMHGYGGATHNLSKKVRTSMAPGLLVPVLTHIMEPKDKFTIETTAAIRTLPTIGPLFGSFELAIDFFTARMSLYNKQLHNNRTNLARSMQTVYFPQMILRGPNPASATFRPVSISDPNKIQINQSALLAYLGVRGLGHEVETSAGSKLTIQRRFNALFPLMYYDVYKEYYANKQESIGAVISGIVEETSSLPTLWGWELQTLLQATSGAYIGAFPSDRGMIVRGYGLRLNADGVTHPLRWNSDAFPDEPVEYKQDPITGYYGWKISSSYMLQYAGTFEIGNGLQEMHLTQRNLSGGTIQQSLINPIPSETAEGTRTRMTIQQFPLENIEKMRDTILAQDAATPLNVTQPVTSFTDFQNMLPYSMLNTNLLYTAAEGASGFAGQTVQTIKGAGLALKTYKSDRFNVWLNTDFVEELTEAVGVSVVDGKVNINDLNTAEKLYNIESRIAATNQTYKGWIEAVYGISPHIEAEIPLFKGGITGEIMFDEVVNVGAEEKIESNDRRALGSLAGRGVMNRFHGTVHVQAQEPCLLMAIASITPRIGYTEGNRWHTRLLTFDDLHKPEYDGIGYQPLLTDEMAAWSTPCLTVTAGGESIPQYLSAGKQVAWSEYMTDVDENYGDFAEKNNADFMVINRDYQALGEDAGSQSFEIEDLTTYIDPRKSNVAFASTGLDAHNFWLHISFGIKAYRPVAAKRVPKI